jgi:hypothetical protein
VRKISILALALSLAVGTMAVAHESDPPGTQYFMFQFDDESVPTADGDPSDWSFVPPFYRITAEKWNTANRASTGGDFDPSEADLATFAPSAVYGWNDNLNRAYVLIEVDDDYHEINRTDAIYIWDDDGLEVRWSASHISKDEYGGYGTVGLDGTAITFQGFAFPPGIEESWWVGFPNFDWNLPGASPYLDVGWSYTGTRLGEGASTYRYEISTEIPFTIAETYEDTEFLDLEEGEIIHANLNMGDADGEFPDNASSTWVFWTTNVDAGNNPEQDFIFAEMDDNVDQTAVEAASWGQIKAGLAK